MKIVNRPVVKNADASAARHSAFPELGRLLLLLILLLSGIYLATGFVIDTLVSHISVKTEVRIFSMGFPKKWQLQEDVPGLESARKILEKLSKNPEAPSFPYRLIVIDMPEPNAFAIPGGTIGVTKSLLDILKEDVELAFVLGHEIGHFKHRDHLRGLGRGVALSFCYAILFGGEMGGQSLYSVFQYVLLRNYSRKQERNADEFGVGMVYEAYGKTDGVERLFEILQNRKELPRWAYMFSTHPSPGERIENLKRYADSYGNL